jgi:hypothetical protein
MREKIHKHIYDNELLLRKWKELLQLSNKIYPNLNRHFIKGEVQVPRKHMENQGVGARYD